MIFIQIVYRCLCYVVSYYSLFRVCFLSKITMWIHGQLFFASKKILWKMCLFNRYWIKRLSLFGGKWKSQISQIDIGINDYIHKDHKNQIGLVCQLFVYILQQFEWNLLKKQVLWKASALNKNYLTEVSRNQFLYKFS